ncbi:MAG: hypothetical protein ACHQPI_11840 [Thermoanaerobaculia bacterium]
MCFALYLAADSPPPLVPWSDSAPAFTVRSLDPVYDAQAKDHLKRRHIVNIGAHTFCACGFRFVTPNPPSPGAVVEDGKTEEPEVAGDMAALVDYLQSFAAKTPVFDLYGVWEEDLGLPTSSVREVAVTELIPETFALREREKLTVRAAAA